MMIRVIHTIRNSSSSSNENMRYDYVTESGKTITQETLESIAVNAGPPTIATEQKPPTTEPGRGRSFVH